MGLRETRQDNGVVVIHVEGQYDERGRNRQASWYYFRMGHVAGREYAAMVRAVSRSPLRKMRKVAPLPAVLIFAKLTWAVTTLLVASKAQSSALPFRPLSIG